MNKSPIKLFVDAHCFDQEHQGTRTFIKGLYNELAQRKNLIIYFGVHDTEQIKKHFPNNGNIHFVKYKSSSSFVRLAVDIPRIIRKYSIHYAHFQYISPLFKCCKQIVTIHDLLFEEYPKEFPLSYRLIKKYLFKRSATQANIITTVSHYSKHSIQKHFEISLKKIEIIPNGVSLNYFESYHKCVAKRWIKQRFGFDKFILCVSRFEPRKNHHLLLEVYLQLRLYEKGYFLLLLGHPSMPVPQFSQLLNSQNAAIRSFIFISDKIEDEALQLFYRAADLFVYPSKAEGFGIPPLEAAATGTPVICSNKTAMNDFGFFGTNHIDVNEQDLLKRAIENAICEAPDFKKLEAISDKIKSSFSWQQSAQAFYQLIINDHEQHDPKTKIREEQRKEAEVSY